MGKEREFCMSSKYGKYILREPLGILPLKEVQTASIIIGHHGYPEGWEGLRFNMAMHSLYALYDRKKMDMCMMKMRFSFSRETIPWISGILEQRPA